MKLPGSRQINDGTNFGNSEMLLSNIIIGRSNESYITLYNLLCAFFLLSFINDYLVLGSRKEDQRRRAESGQTENDCHGSQEDRRTLSSAMRAIRILFDERPQQTTSIVLTRRGHRQGKYFNYVNFMSSTRRKWQNSSFRS